MLEPALGENVDTEGKVHARSSLDDDAGEIETEDCRQSLCKAKLALFADLMVDWVYFTN